MAGMMRKVELLAESGERADPPGTNPNWSTHPGRPMKRVDVGCQFVVKSNT